LDIFLTSDFEQARERWVKEPMEFLTSAHLSPKGDRLALTARGRVFIAPVKQGRLVSATRDSHIRYRNAKFMPDGKTVLALTDETKELEFCLIPVNGIGQPTGLTQDGTVFRYAGTPSPDGKWVVFGDKDQRLWLLNMESRTCRCIAESEAWGSFFDWSWSPDSLWLAYVAPCENQFTQIRLYSLANETTLNLTSDRVDSYSPVWSPDGKWIYFLSDRHFKSLVMSPWGPRQPEPYFDKTTKIYHVPLVKGERSPFQPLDELHQAFLEQQEAEEKEAEAHPSSEQDPTRTDTPEIPDLEAVTVVMDVEGLQQRVMEVPLGASNYRNLSITDSRIFWTDTVADADEKQSLNFLELKNDPIEPKVVMDGIRSYELSMDGTKLLIRKDKDFYVVDADKEAPKDKELEKRRVDLSNWAFSVYPRDEWRQMLVEAWRLERDYFYDRNLHGVDWSGLLEKHLPLVERVTDRDELNNLIAQLVGELAALHTFVVAGDRRKVQDRVGLASLGAVLSRMDTGYRIDYLYQHDPDYPDRAGPLTRPEVALQVGDVIESVNGVSPLTVPDPAALLKNQADQQVLLQVKPKDAENSRWVIVEPVSTWDAADLRYTDWELRCRERVETQGESKLGYVHLRAMGRDNFTEWVENYYPIFNREGLIIDVRHNRGGNIDSWILEKLLRKAWFFWQPRVGKPFWNMQWAFRGHMVVLCNEHTASDGEAFTEGFRRLGLGKIIGTRTWGGEIWLSFNTWLVDRGIASAAEIGVYGPEGEWLIEGHGVEPDIVVDNLPHSTFKGEDAQLDYAISYLQEQIRQNPVTVPPPPEYPNKSFSYE
ncbi:MAG: S41 family peptidase, partial [Leptolyngbyaceae bacterium]|nr:S41 family peptidase [Leptolyngbyaceae bacterium]